MYDLVIFGGLIADLVVLDPETVIDTADFDHPTRLSSGIHHVAVAGKIVYQNQSLTGVSNGKVLLACGQ